MFVHLFTIKAGYIFNLLDTGNGNLCEQSDCLPPTDGVANMLDNQHTHEYKINTFSFS